MLMICFFGEGPKYCVEVCFCYHYCYNTNLGLEFQYFVARVVYFWYSVVLVIPNNSPSCSNCNSALPVVVSGLGGADPDPTN